MPEDVNGRSPTSYNLGGSIIYAVNRDFNLMLEGLEEWNESVDGFGKIQHDAAFTISPGRALCPLLYLSIEHDASFLPH